MSGSNYGSGGASAYLDDMIDFFEDKPAAPCRDTRVLTWIVGVLGADMLLDIIDSQRGGTLTERGKREMARVRITEIGEGLARG